MIKIEDQCVGCDAPGYPCLGRSCPRRAVEVHVCDECGEELDRYCYGTNEDEELCEECFKEKYERRIENV